MNMMKLLSKANKPQRYIGSELNSIKKVHTDDLVKVLVGYPDLYEVGMSNMALRIFYYLLNNREDCLAERIFTPAPDFIEILKEKDVPLFSIETHTPIKEFDLICFTLQYELTYSAMLSVIDLGKIPVRSEERGENDPFIVVGGPCATNPEPVSPFVDLVCIGDGEEIFEDLVRVSKETRGMKRIEKLKAYAEIDGVFAPAIEKKVKRRIIANLDDAFHPVTSIVPFMPTVHDRVSIEISRGCPHGCRFCHAGFTYRPYRERSVAKLVEIAEEMVKNTGYNEITLASLSSSDYSKINELVETLNTKFTGKNVSLALPSLRISNFSVQLAKSLGMVKRGGLTFAPEAGSDKMRVAVNKGVVEKDLMDSVEAAVNAGWKRVKLYFMLGLPGETDEDAKEIANLAIEAQRLGKSISKSGFKVTVNISAFVPKPHTPYQWSERIDKDTYLNRVYMIKEKIFGKNISIKYSNTFISELETIFSRGDAKTAELLYSAWKHGACFDGWEEYINREAWDKAVEEMGINWDDNFKATDPGGALPWDYIDMIVKKEYLVKELEKSNTGKGTEICDTGSIAEISDADKCRTCGVCK